MKFLVLLLVCLGWSYGEARGIGFNPAADSLNDGVPDGLNDGVDSLNDVVKLEDHKMEEIEEASAQAIAEATVEVEEAEEEVSQQTEDEVEKTNRLIPILMRLQTKYPTLANDEQVKVLRQASGYKEDFKDALDKLEASPEISHDLNIPYLRQILGVVRIRKPKKSNTEPSGESPLETNMISKEGEDTFEGVLADDNETASEGFGTGDFIDPNSEIITEGLFAFDYDPNSRIANEGLFADDIIDLNSKIVTEGLFAANMTDSDEEDYQDFPFARAASYVDQDRIPPPSQQNPMPLHPSELPNSSSNSDPSQYFDNFINTNYPFDAFDEVDINLNFAAPFPIRKQKLRRKPTVPLYNPLMRSYPYPSPIAAQPYPFRPLYPHVPQTPIYHQNLQPTNDHAPHPPSMISSGLLPPTHYIPTTPTYHRRMRRSTTHSQHTPYYSYPRHQMYHPYWDTSYQQASRYQPLGYGQYNPYVFDYQTSASLDDPLLTAHYPSDYYGYSMQPLPSLRPNNPFSSMQSPGLALNPHYQYSRAAYRNYLHMSMDGMDPVQYVKGLTGV